MSKKLDAAIEAVEQARSRQALDDGVMHDYVDVGRARLYRPTIIHGWVITRLTMEADKLTPFDLQLVVGYVLAHDAETVRNRIAAEVRKNIAKLPQIAENYFVAHDANVTDTLEVISELLQDLRGKKKAAMTTTEPPASPAGGAAPSMASP